MAIYNGKHVVFEQVGVENDTYVWNQSSNKDSDNCYNNYDISNMRNSVLPTISTKISNELYAVLTNTTIQTAKNGMSSTLVSTSDKLFLMAGKEINYTTYNVPAEVSALITWQYYTSHNYSSDRIKYDSTSTARLYWLRSPYSGSETLSLPITSDGNYSVYYTSVNALRVSVCFAW